MCPPLWAAAPCIFAVLQKCQRALPCARPFGRLRRAFLLSCKNVSGHYKPCARPFGRLRRAFLLSCLSGHFRVPAPLGGCAVHFCCPQKCQRASVCPPLWAAAPCIFAVLQKCQRALPCARPFGRLRRAFLLSCKNVSGHFRVPAPLGGCAVHFCCPAKMSAGAVCPPLWAAAPCIFAVLQKCQRALPCARPFGRLRRAFLLSCKNVSGHFRVPAPLGGCAVHFCCPAKMSAGTSVCPPLWAAAPCIFAVLQKCQRALPCARPFGRLRRAFFCKNALPCARPFGRLRRAFLCPAKMSAGTSVCPPLWAACIFAVLQKCQRALPCARPFGRLRRAFLLSCKNVSGHIHVPAPLGGCAVHFCCPAKMSAGTSVCPPLWAAAPCIFAVLQKCQRALPCARPFGRLRRAFLLSCKNVSGHFRVPAPLGGCAVHFCCPAKMSAGTSVCPPLWAAAPCIFAVLQKCQRAHPCARPFGRLRRAFLLPAKMPGTSMCPPLWAAAPCIFAVLVSGAVCPPLWAAAPCIFAVLQKCQRAARPFGRLRRAFLLSCKNVSGHFRVPAPLGGCAVHFCCPAKMSAGTSVCPPLWAAAPCIFAVLQKCQRAHPCARPFGRLRRAFLLSCKNVSGHFRVPAPLLRRAFLLSCCAVHFCCPAKMC